MLPALDLYCFLFIHFNSAIAYHKGSKEKKIFKGRFPFFFRFKIQEDFMTNKMNHIPIHQEWAKVSLFGLVFMILAASCSVQPTDTLSERNGTSAGSGKLGAKIEGGFGTLNGFFYNASTKAYDQNLYLRFKITSDAPQPVPLEFVTIRYYFTEDGEQSLNFMPDYAGGNTSPNTYCDLTSTVRGAFYPISPAISNADHYLEVSFDQSAGSINPGSSIVVQARIGKSDWSSFNQTNDFSFNPSATDYTDWDNVPLYFSGALVYGTEPRWDSKLFFQKGGPFRRAALFFWINHISEDLIEPD